MNALFSHAVLSLLLCSSGLALAQQQGAPTRTPTEASKRLTELNKLHAGRDTESPEARAQRVRDLEGFLADHPSSAEATSVRFAICQLAIKDTQFVAAAKTALEGFDPKAAEEGAGLLAVRFSSQLGFDEIKGRIKQQVVKRPESLADKLELSGNIKIIARDNEWAEEFRTAIEQSATTSADRAEIALFDAAMVSRLDRKNREAYDAALRRVAEDFADTPSGALAKDKLAAHSLAVGSAPIEFAAVDLAGQPVSLADYRGKVLLVDFWATWCVPCMKEMPHVVAAHERFHSQGFEVLGISLDRTGHREKLEGVIAANKMAWRHVFDGGHWRAKVAQRYDVSSIPFTVLIGKDGKIAGLNLRGDLLAEAVERELAK
jgi:peroxiredoxin